MVMRKNQGSILKNKRGERSMAQAQQSQKAPQWWNDTTLFWHHFQRNTYISAAWNWSLIFVGKGAEPYLCLSVLYQGASLLPGVTLPDPLSNAVYIGQQLALDIGGMSLAKQARQTRAEGNEEQANLERNVGVSLIGMILLNVVLAYIHRLNMLDASVITGIESALLIVRAIMAVIYGYVIYAPSEATSERVVKSNDVHDRLDQFSQQLQVVQNSVPLLVQEGVQKTVQAQSHVIISEVQQVVQNSVSLLISEQGNEQVSELAQAVQTLQSEQANGQALHALSEQVQRLSTAVSEMRTTLTVNSRKNESEQVAQRIKQFIVDQRRRGSEPSLAEIMDKCNCSKGTVIRYRRELNDGTEQDIVNQ